MCVCFFVLYHQSSPIEAVKLLQSISSTVSDRKLKLVVSLGQNKKLFFGHLKIINKNKNMYYEEIWEFII